MRKSFTLLCVSIALQFRVVNLYYICRVFVEVISKALCFKTNAFALSLQVQKHL